MNGIPHQDVTTLAIRQEQSPSYFLPYERAVSNPLRNVLVIGAGTGTDVAIALSEGAQRVDAVEIDPELYRRGRELNPEHPYDDPRVGVEIGDGRAFLNPTDRTYDLILFALLFGTTWFVNALVFGGILLTVLLAIEVATRVRRIAPLPLYGALAVSLAVAYMVPGSALLDLAVIPRFVAATALAFAPVFFANLVFAERFRDVEASTVAFGANLLGAMLGGTLEYTSLVIGYRALLPVAATLYALAALAGRSHLRRVA